ncbi:hypothetical protein [Kamptonema formosum]|uniref:hypothetical protein n=1 Tax=Kamptonema formosum TaxID=331992 RepID=UPI0012DC9AC5|nr:hypothetical protein [Oscillatoria sp. PCC 10802]
MNTPLDDNSHHSPHSRLDGLRQSLGLDSHRHGGAQYPDSHLGDAGQLHPHHRDLFNGVSDFRQPAHHSNSGDSGIPDFTSSWDDCGAFAFNGSGGGQQRIRNDAHRPDAQNRLSDFSNFDTPQQPGSAGTDGKIYGRHDKCVGWFDREGRVYNSAGVGFLKPPRGLWAELRICLSFIWETFRVRGWQKRGAPWGKAAH